MSPSKPGNASKSSTAQSGRERAAAIRKQYEARTRRIRAAVYGAVAVVVVAAIVAVWIGVQNSNTGPPASAAGLSKVSGVGAASVPPWPAPADANARAKAAGLDIGPMGTADHYHAHLDVIVEGRKVPVPPDLGVDASTGGMSALHTHSPDGLVHVEAGKTGETFTLGQLFTQWNVKLTARQLGSLSTGKGRELKVYVDGKPVAENPAMVKIADKQQISLVYGDPSQEVDIPESYDFSGV